MVEEKRSYRKNYSSHGLIYLAEQELKISVRNLSITGLFAELDANEFISEVDEIFSALTLSVTVDLYLPETGLAGEADVVRVEKVEGCIYFALEFRSLTYDVNNLRYQRKAYRKSIITIGEIVFDNKPYTFLAQNVSVDGVMIHLKESLDIKEGTVTSFDFHKLNLTGEAKVIWTEHEANGSTLMGLEYVLMIQEHIKGVPHFKIHQE